MNGWMEGWMECIGLDWIGLQDWIVGLINGRSAEYEWMDNMDGGMGRWMELKLMDT